MAYGITVSFRHPPTQRMGNVSLQLRSGHCGGVHLLGSARRGHRSGQLSGFQVLLDAANGNPRQVISASAMLTQFTVAVPGIIVLASVCCAALEK